MKLETLLFVHDFTDRQGHHFTIQPMSFLLSKQSQSTKMDIDTQKVQSNLEYLHDLSPSKNYYTLVKEITIANVQHATSRKQCTTSFEHISDVCALIVEYQTYQEYTKCQSYQLYTSRINRFTKSYQLTY